jgi:hypothetical protein
MSRILVKRSRSIHMSAAVVAVALSTMLIGVAHARAATYMGLESQIAFHSSPSGEMWVLETPKYNNESGIYRTSHVAMAAGATPGVGGWHFGSGQFLKAAFEGANNSLYEFTWGGSTFTGLPMSPTATPSVSDNGSADYAYRNAEGHLVIHRGNSEILATGFGMAAGTNPSITEYEGEKGSLVAFVANGTNNLYLYNPKTGEHPEYSLGIAPGSSPALATNGGNWEAAFRANGSGNLYLHSSATGNTELGFGMAPGTTPGIVRWGSGYLIAFEAAGTNHLLLFDTTTWKATDTGLGMAPGTNPSITVRSPGYWEVVFQSNTGYLWQDNSQSGARGLGYTLAPGTSPSVAP